jgi:hypothetical protein
MPSRKTTTSTSPGPQPPAPATRLIFEYDGDEVRLVSQQPVDMAVTGADLAQEYTAGTFVDARDAANRTLVRVHARGMSDGTAEVFPEKPGEPILRVKLDRPRGAFTVVLPAPQAAARVAVVRVQPVAAAPAATARQPGEADTAARGPAAAPALQTTELASFALQRKP